MPAFECKCSFKLEGKDPDDLHFAITEFTNLTDERHDVLEAFFMRRERMEDVELLVEAADEKRALALAEELIAAIQKTTNERFGEGAVRAGELDVRAESDETLALLEQLSELDLTDAEELLATIEDEAADEPLKDPYAAMQEAGTNGDNYGLDTDAIIRRLRKWEQEATFDVVDVGSSYVTVVFLTLPENLEAFADEAYAFCPDLADDLHEMEQVDELDGDDEAVDKLVLGGIARQLKEERILRFWWD